MADKNENDLPNNSQQPPPTEQPPLQQEPSQQRTPAEQTKRNETPKYTPMSRAHQDVEKLPTRADSDPDPPPPRRQKQKVFDQERIIKTTEEQSGGGFEKITVFLSFLILLLTFPISIFMCLIVLAEYERAVIFRLGRLRKGGARGPGLIFILPCVDRFVKVDMRTASFDVPPQEILTKDSVTIKVDAVVYYSIKNPLDAVIQVADCRQSTKLLAQTTLRNVAGSKNLTELLTSKEMLSRQIADVLDEATDPWGVNVERVEIKDIRLPYELQRALAAEAEALREARAKIIAAEGELKASNALKEASDVMAENDITLQYNLTVAKTQPKSTPKKFYSKEIYMPTQLQRSMAVEQEALREAMAKVAAAEGERDAARMLKDAADVMISNPIALQLRYLQTLNTITNKNTQAYVFPLPMDIIRKMLG